MNNISLPEPSDKVKNIINAIIKAGGVSIGSRYLNLSTKYSDYDFIIKLSQVTPSLLEFFKDGRKSDLNKSTYGIAGVKGNLYSLYLDNIQLLVFNDGDQYDEQLARNIKMKEYLETLSPETISKIIELKNKTFGNIAIICYKGSLFFNNVLNFIETNPVSFTEFYKFLNNKKAELRSSHWRDTGEGEERYIDNTKFEFLYPIFVLLWCNINKTAQDNIRTIRSFYSCNEALKNSNTAKKTIRFTIKERDEVFVVTTTCTTFMRLFSNLYNNIIQIEIMD